MLFHPFEPVWDRDSQILILGTFPSVKSRENGFYYGHPQNRFWRVLASVLNEPLPETIPQKTEMLLKNHIALWDVLSGCEIEGSSDASIRSETPNDLSALLSGSRIKRVYTNGKAAHRLYQKHSRPLTDTNDLCLPSTSPANAAWSLQALAEAWQVIKKDLEK